MFAPRQFLPCRIGAQLQTEGKLIVIGAYVKNRRTIVFDDFSALNLDRPFCEGASGSGKTTLLLIAGLDGRTAARSAVCRARFVRFQDNRLLPSCRQEQTFESFFLSTTTLPIGFQRTRSLVCERSTGIDTFRRGTAPPRAGARLGARVRYSISRRSVPRAR